MRKETEMIYYITKQQLKELLMLEGDIIFVISSSTNDEIKIITK